MHGAWAVCPGGVLLSPRGSARLTMFFGFLLVPPLAGGDGHGYRQRCSPCASALYRNDRCVHGAAPVVLRCTTRAVVLVARTSVICIT